MLCAINTLQIAILEYKINIHLMFETSTAEKPNYANFMVKKSSSKIMGLVAYMITIKETSISLAIK